MELNLPNTFMLYFSYVIIAFYIYQNFLFQLDQNDNVVKPPKYPDKVYR